MAPEILNGESATYASDIYSLGVVLYEALAGVKPFDGKSPMAVLNAISMAKPRSLATLRPDLSPTLVASVERAMAYDKQHRFQSADEMLEWLGRAQPTIVSDLPLPLVVGGKQSSRRRNPVLSKGLAAAAALLLVLVLVSGIAVTFDHQPSSSQPQAPSSSTTTMSVVVTRLQRFSAQQPLLPPQRLPPQQPSRLLQLLLPLQRLLPARLQLHQRETTVPVKTPLGRLSQRKKAKTRQRERARTSSGQYLSWAVDDGRRAAFAEVVPCPSPNRSNSCAKAG